MKDKTITSSLRDLTKEECLTLMSKGIAVRYYKSGDKSYDYGYYEIKGTESRIKEALKNIVDKRLLKYRLEDVSNNIIGLTSDILCCRDLIAKKKSDLSNLNETNKKELITRLSNCSTKIIEIQEIIEGKKDTEIYSKYDFSGYNELK